MYESMARTQTVLNLKASPPRVQLKLKKNNETPPSDSF